MVEVDGFPRVENDRAWLGCDVVFSEPVAVHAANVAVEAGCDFVEAFAIGADEPWGGVGLSVGEADFTAEQHFAAANHAAGIGQAFRGKHAVAAPGHVCGVDVAVREAEAFFTDAEQQGGIEVWASGHGCFGEAAEGEVLTLWGAFAQMVAGGGEDFVGVGRHGECEFDLADFELAFAGVHDFGVLADEAGFVEFAGPDEFHMLFHVFCGDGNGWGLLGFVGHAPARVSVFFTHDVGFASCHGFGGDVADCELAEQFHAVAAHVEAGCANPGFGLRGQYARPWGVVERAGNALWHLRVEHVDHGCRGCERTAPVHKSRQIIAGEYECERHVRGWLFGVDRSEFGTVGSVAMEGLNERHCSILYILRLPCIVTFDDMSSFIC